MSNPFNKGDSVTLTADIFKSITYGRVYEVMHSSFAFVRLVNDRSQLVSYRFNQFRLAVTVAPMTATQVLALQAKYVNNPYDDTFEGDDITGEPEAYKHATRVCSLGKFKTGDRLVYCDGTPITIDGGAFVVHRCTATMILFEHCYTWPFNPDEFQLEGESIYAI